ncbi:Abi family protein [Mycoplasma mycoides]|uniref:CAAX protease n=1 Tax=Mycoplasma mycoides subsp. capri TaxID=40477 RepID=A0AB38GGF4_MYCMC|nr:Abi family protein [Mycoplasma mycoides]SRX61034.1 CAAX protease [Mycoplasma mycoides subsp. capri]SRX62675.1 CAAX protease [Mycoplasma mycoides subsp. capri]SRX62927.1 CAAX protease [Mycoplasma mycoides subsp. capri]SRX63944.1 CAAX protease [Mycoplasma mycoides subsp. capri]SRX65344.1 CAAX protease [Mycoplasma mycoides subsp. capri]
MKRSKEFKTFEEQIEILKSRGLIIKDEQKAIEILKQENYYNIVNGYKDLFLKNTLNDKEDVFIENTTFDELYSLFLFDRELRSILLKYILIFERDFKTTIAYNFSKKYNKNNIIDSYLYPENYRDNYVEVLNFISSINNIIVSKSEKSNYIRHYIENYGHIPLWVAVNIMSFGNMSFMFKILKDEDRNQIILFYVMRFLSQNNKKVIPTKFRSETFLSGLKILNLARNICAHEERMYNAQFDRVKTKEISRLLEYSDYDGSRLISVFLFLKVVLIEKSFTLLKKDILEIFTKFQNRFKTIEFGDILKEMGIKLENFYQL